MSLKGKIVVFSGFTKDSLKKKLVEAGAQVVTPSSIITVTKDNVDAFTEKYVPCEPGKVRNPKTGRCIKKKPVVAPKKKTPESKSPSPPKVVAAPKAVTAPVIPVVDEKIASFKVEGNGKEICQEVTVTLVDNIVKSMRDYISEHRSLADITVKLPATITKTMKKGAMVMLNYNQIQFDRNNGIFGVWDGKTVVPLDYDWSDSGFLPSKIDPIGLDVPIDYWQDSLLYREEYVWLNLKNPKVKVKHIDDIEIYVFKCGGKEYAVEAEERELNVFEIYDIKDPEYFDL